MIDEVWGTLAGRWYVTGFGVAFAVLAVRHLGWRRTLTYTVIAVAVGVVAENGSASELGLPYGRYEFDKSLRGQELWVGDVPLMVSLSYTFMSYFGFATARWLVAGPRHTRSRSAPVQEYVLAVVLTVWMIWVVDPVSRLGEHFFLGHLFDYEGPGFWFGLPVLSQVGFTLTSAVLVGVLTLLARDEVPEPVAGPWWRHPRAAAAGGYLGQVLFMAGTALWVARTTDDPAVAATADALAGSAVLLYLPLLVLVPTLWTAAGRDRRPARALAPVDGDRTTVRPGPVDTASLHPSAARADEGSRSST